MTARCSICQKLFAGPQILLVGQGLSAPNNRLMQFLQKLTEHIHIEHRDEAKGIALAANEYQGMLILSKYETQSQDLQTQLDLCRWNVHQKTLAVRFTDAQIRDWVEKIVPELLTLADMRDTLAITTNLVRMLQSIRDHLEEPGKYTFRPPDAA